MNTQAIMTMIFTFLGTSGGLAIIQAITSRKKNNQEVTTSTIKNAMELEKVAVERWKSSLDKIDAAEKLLIEVRKEMELKDAYIIVIKDLLKKHDIPVPKQKKFNGEAED